MSARDPVYPADVVQSVALDSLTHRDHQATAVTVRVLLPLRQTNGHIHRSTEAVDVPHHVRVRFPIIRNCESMHD